MAGQARKRFAPKPLIARKAGKLRHWLQAFEAGAENRCRPARRYGSVLNNERHHKQRGRPRTISGCQRNHREGKADGQEVAGRNQPRPNCRAPGQSANGAFTPVQLASTQKLCHLKRMFLPSEKGRTSPAPRAAARRSRAVERGQRHRWGRKRLDQHLARQQSGQSGPGWPDQWKRQPGPLSRPSPAGTRAADAARGS